MFEFCLAPDCLAGIFPTAKNNWRAISLLQIRIYAFIFSWPQALPNNLLRSDSRIVGPSVELNQGMDEVVIGLLREGFKPFWMRYLVYFVL